MGQYVSYSVEAKTAPLDNRGNRHTDHKHRDYGKVVEKVLGKTESGPETDWHFYPRGWVSYNEEKRKFHVVADRCMLKDEEVMKKIMSDFHLSRDKAKIKIERDRHYRCAKCKQPDSRLKKKQGQKK